MSDIHDERAARILPCKCEDHHREGSVICPASYRPALAAEFRADAEKHKAEVEQVNKDRNRLIAANKYYLTKTEQLQAELASLRAENERLEQDLGVWDGREKEIVDIRSRLEQAEKERDADAKEKSRLRGVITNLLELKNAAKIEGLKAAKEAVEKRSLKLSENPENGYFESDTNAFVWTSHEAARASEELDELADAIQALIDEAKP